MGSPCWSTRSPHKQCVCLCSKYKEMYGRILKSLHIQGAKKVVSDSPGLVDFAIGLVNSVLNLPDGQAKIFWRNKITKVL